MTDTHSNPSLTTGAKVVEQLKNSGALDELFAKIDSGEVELTGDGGLVPVLIKETLERGLQAELTSHLGYEPGGIVKRRRRRMRATAPTPRQWPPRWGTLR